LEQRARDLLTQFGYKERPLDRAFGFTYSGLARQYVERNVNAEEFRTVLARAQPAIVQFWYRHGAATTGGRFAAGRST
jgi:hypothetical protein